MRKKIKRKNNEQDRFAVVLEAIQSDFQVFGERQDLMDSKIDRLSKDAQIIKQEIFAIKSELRDIKETLVQKADLRRLKELERRVGHIEMVLAKKNS